MSDPTCSDLPPRGQHDACRRTCGVRKSTVSFIAQLLGFPDRTKKEEGEKKNENKKGFRMVSGGVWRQGARKKRCAQKKKKNKNKKDAKNRLLGTRRVVRPRSDREKINIKRHKKIRYQGDKQKPA